MRVLWTQPAEEHLADIYRALSTVSPRYAQRMVDRITSRTKRLALFPESGPVIPRAEALDIPALHEPPYRILYVLGADHVDILGVLHGSRDSFI